MGSLLLRMNSRIPCVLLTQIHAASSCPHSSANKAFLPATQQTVSPAWPPTSKACTQAHDRTGCSASGAVLLGGRRLCLVCSFFRNIFADELCLGAALMRQLPPGR